MDSSLSHYGTGIVAHLGQWRLLEARLTFDALCHSIGARLCLAYTILHISCHYACPCQHVGFDGGDRHDNFCILACEPRCCKSHEALFDVDGVFYCS